MAFVLRVLHVPLCLDPWIFGFVCGSIYSLDWIMRNMGWMVLLEQKGGIDDRMRVRMTTQHAKPPQIYGLPKIHKEGVPLRPIVSAIGSQHTN